MTDNCAARQVTKTFETLVLVTPAAFVVEHNCPAGLLATDIAYDDPNLEVNENVQLPLTVIKSMPLFNKPTAVPEDNPETLPPIFMVVPDGGVETVTQLTSTFVIAPLTVPLPLVTEHVCPSGCVPTEIKYGAFAIRVFGKTNTPFAASGRGDPLFKFKLIDTLVESPITEPVTENADVAGDAEFEFGLDGLLPPPQAVKNDTVAIISKSID